MGSDLVKCVKYKNNKDNYFSKIAIIAPDANVKARAKVFFTKYFLQNSGLNALCKAENRTMFTVDMYST